MAAPPPPGKTERGWEAGRWRDEKGKERGDLWSRVAGRIGGCRREETLGNSQEEREAPTEGREINNLSYFLFS